MPKIRYSNGEVEEMNPLAQMQGPHSLHGKPYQEDYNGLADAYFREQDRLQALRKMSTEERQELLNEEQETALPDKPIYK